MEVNYHVFLILVVFIFWNLDKFTRFSDLVKFFNFFNFFNFWPDTFLPITSFSLTIPVSISKFFNELVDIFNIEVIGLTILLKP